MSKEKDNNGKIGKKKFKDSDLVIVSEILPDKLTIIPIKQRPIFPGITIPLNFSGKKMIDTFENVYENENRLLGFVLVKKEGEENVFDSQMYKVGTVVKLLKIATVSKDTIHVIIQGLQRFTYISTAWKKPFLKWKVRYHYEKEQKPDEELKAYTMAIISSLKELLRKNQMIQEQLKIVMSQISYDKPSQLLDVVASLLNADPPKLQMVLEKFELIERSKEILTLLKEELEISYVQEKIEKQIEEKISKQKREFFLREEMKAIKKELGLEKDDKTAEIERFKDRLKKLKLTQEASQVINSELQKLKMLSPASPEYNVTRNYLDYLTELPWGVYSKENLNIKLVKKILNQDHYGLEDVKNRILEFISTIIKRGSIAGSILCLVGPPGVGKTSVGHSIARAMNRKFFRFSLGGMRDEAEIKGHRRTYIGAMPGKIMQSLRRTFTANPVIMLDEIDKVQKSFHGDPASALLEVLDPEQNKSFLDHYLDVHFDLSKILFITTANQLDTIPRPLLDRMEVIKLAGYILEEKVEIAKRFLIPKQLKQHGLLKKEINITNKAIKLIVNGYAREAGVRSLENNIKKIMRKVTLDLVEKKRKKFSISYKNLQKYLGKPVFATEKLYERKITGLALGLAWTTFGGSTIYVEASAVRSKNSGFKQTGQLGKVMQESSEIAYSYVRSILSKKKELSEYFDNNFIHLHVPAGATPKDGPSAGITMALALYSLATQKAVSKRIAMTGELTLTGKVLPVGGIKEKTIAARRVDVYEIILPIENKKDFDDLPQYIKKGIKVHYAMYFEDILDVVYPKK